MKPQASRKRRLLGHGAGAVVGLALVVALGWGLTRVVVGVVLEPLLFWAETNDWRPVSCEIARSETRTRRIGLTHLTVFEVRYRYEAGGRGRTATRFHPMLVSPIAEAADAAAQAKRYPRGSEATCYVDPDDAGRAVLTRAADAVMWGRFVPIAALMVLFPLLAMIGLGWMTASHIAGLWRLRREAGARNAWERRAAALRAAGRPVNHETMHDPSEPVDEPVPDHEP